MEIKEEQIYTFILMNGQELVGELQSIDDNYYHLLSPLTLGRDDKGNMGFIMPSQSGEQLGETAVLHSAVALLKATREDVVEAYKTSVDPSEIITPQTKQIITG